MCHSVEEHHAIDIRQASSDDCDAIYAIEAVMYDFPWRRSMIATALDLTSPFNLCALFDTAVVGYILCGEAAGELEIHKLAVDPRFLRRGIASRLVANGINEAQHSGITAIFLEVRVSNRAAISLYRGVGFQHHSIRKRYYSGNGEDAVVMVRWIEQ
jgi:ribosomal-protein-alanine N-acetyltransferase